MIVAIERNRFTQLFKYDEITIGLNSVLDIEVEELIAQVENPQTIDLVAKQMNRILPIFELDHEVLLLEVDKATISLGGEVKVFFHSIRGIYPLSEEGESLLLGKLNGNLRVHKPIFSKAVKKVKTLRNHEFRKKCAQRLLTIFGLKNMQNDDFQGLLITEFERITSEIERPKDALLYHLLTYSKTPSFLPSGNVEFIAKIGVITLLRMGKDGEKLKGGIFYNKLVENKSIINEGSLFEGLANFRSLLNDEELKASLDKITNNMGKVIEGLDIFAIAYYFIAIKAYLNRNDKNLLPIAEDLLAAARNDPSTFAQVLVLIGYSFSFEELYESIHSLENAPILKETMVLDRERRISQSDHRDQKNQALEETKRKSECGKVNEPVEGEVIYTTKRRKQSPPRAVIESSQLRVEDDISTVEQSSSPNELSKKKETKFTGSKKGHEQASELLFEDSNPPGAEDDPDVQGQGHSVKNFLAWIQGSALSKVKKNNWGKLIKYHFQDQGAEITFEALKKIVETNRNAESELFTKSGKGKFSLESSKAFFKK